MPITRGPRPGSKRAKPDINATSPSSPSDDDYANSIGVAPYILDTLDKVSLTKNTKSTDFPVLDSRTQSRRGSIEVPSSSLIASAPLNSPNIPSPTISDGSLSNPEAIRSHNSGHGIMSPFSCRLEFLNTREDSTSSIVDVPYFGGQPVDLGDGHLDFYSDPLAFLSISNKFSYLPPIFLPSHSTPHPVPSTFTVPLGLEHPDFQYIPCDAISDLITKFFEHVYIKLPILHFHVFICNFKSYSKFLLYAMFASSARYAQHAAIELINKQYFESRPSSTNVENGDQQWRRAKDGDFFFDRLKDLVQEIIQRPSLEAVVAVTIMSNYAAESGRVRENWLFRALAIKMAFALKLNEEIDDDTVLVYGDIERELRRRTFWSLYCEFFLT